MAQHIITWLIVGVAAVLVIRHIWREIDGFIHPDRAGECPGCGMCDAAQDAKKSGRRPLEPKVTPLVRLDTRAKGRPDTIHTDDTEE